MNYLLGQTVCTAPGQKPSSAIPLCNRDIFKQTTLSLCRNANLFVPGCTDSRTEYGDKNPFYFKITCVTGGTIAFTITPNVLTDDYNWQLFDITGHDPNDIFTGKTLVVTGNWSGTGGLTGASSTGVNFIQCGYNLSNEVKPTFSSMPLLVTGHTYLLLVSQQDDNSTDGFSLQVTGGTADISDTLIPELINVASVDCTAPIAAIVFNKKIRCSSIAADGSDFTLSPSTSTIVSATPLNCNTAGDADTIFLTFDKTLANDDYAVAVKQGIDGNTMEDRCGNQVAVGSMLFLGHPGKVL